MATIADGASYREFEVSLARSDDADDLNRFGDQPISPFSLQHVVSMVRANLLVIIAILLAALALAVTLTLLQTPLYTATASIQINEQSDRVLKEGDVSENSTDFYDTDRFLQTQIDILRSRGLAQRVAQSLKLTGDPAFYRAMGVEPMPADTPASVMRDVTFGLLLGNLQVDLPRNSRIVDIDFVSPDPAFSAKVANAFVKEFIAASLQRKYDSSAYARSFVSEQLAEAKGRLEASEEAVNAYARAAGLIVTGQGLGKSSDGAQGSSVVSASLDQLNRAANDARTARISAEGRWRGISGGTALNAPEVLANSSVQGLLLQRADLQTKLQLERAKHLPEHPTVIQLQAQVAEINRQINALVGSVRSGVRAQYDAALSNERQLEAQVANLKSASMSEQDRSVQYNILAREANTNRVLYDGLLQRFKELNAAAGISASNISVIDNADPPLGPSSPNLLANILIGLVLGGAFAVAVVFARDQFDDAIRVPEDVEHKLGLSLLGVIPKSDQNVDEEIKDPKAAVSEAYNSLGGSLLYSTSEGLPRVMLITSAQPTEGKSTSSFAIASGFARIGRRTVLIDLDLRRPSLHRRIGTDNKLGMTTLLTSSEPVETVILPMEQPRLSVITSGPIPPAPTELIGSHRMQALIDELSGKFDVVIVDSPPVLGLADAPLMAPLVDGVIMVIEANRSRRGTLKAALRRLRAMRPLILGAVLTKFDGRKASYGYSGYYNTNYYQYRSDEPQTGKRAKQAA